MIFMYIGDDKQTTELAKGIQYSTRKAQAKEFYASRDILDAATFESAAWEDLHETL